MNVRPSRGCCLVCGFVGGWLLGCRNSAKPFLKSPNSRLAAAQTADFLKTTQISASQESTPLLQSRSQPAPVSPAVRFRAGGSGGGVGRLAEVGIDEGWRIEWIPGSWMSHQRCAGWLGGDGGCGSSVGEGTVRGGRQLVVTRCAPCSAAAPVCCHSRKLASLKQ